MACMALTDELTSCPTLEELNVIQLMEEETGEYINEDRFSVTKVCGPVEAITDACCYVLTEFEYDGPAMGRPFTIDGNACIAEPSLANGWGASHEWAGIDIPIEHRVRLAQHWTQMAQFEHASVASFARFTLQLMAAGAPAELVARATKAQADEIRHARSALGIANAIDGEERGLGSLPIADALSEAEDIRALLIDTIHEACVNETISAAQCEAAGSAAADPFIQETLLAIAHDEQEHAALAWATVKWILRTHPELADDAREAFESALEKPYVSEERQSDALAAWGVLSTRAEEAVANRAKRRIIRPCMNALLGNTHQVAVAPE